MIITGTWNWSRNFTLVILNKIHDANYFNDPSEQ